MPRLSEARLRDRQETILDAAEEVLSRSGFAEASVAEVARQAGVSDGLIYRYFESKQAMRDAVLARFYGRVLDGARMALGAHTGFADRLLALIETHLGIFGMIARCAGCSSPKCAWPRIIQARHCRI
jgi:TetR/AcrR family fatty acid metabolism transcriptional regulator